MTTDAAILRALRVSQEQGISGAALSQQLGISRAAIWARIEELRSLGYGIEASPHQGYRLTHVPDVLHGDDLTTRIQKSKVVGRRIQVFRETTSTNDVVEKLARDGVPEGYVVFAEHQTKGRGRLSRKWESNAGKGLWFSVLLRPRFAPQAATRMTIAAATALARALRVTAGVAAEIKWPNDIQVGGRKVAGILTELSAEMDGIKHLILGVGVNVNHERGDFPEELHAMATSLRMETGHFQDRATLAVSILEALDEDYQLAQGEGFESLIEEWERNCNTLGRHVRIRMGARELEGRAESLDGEGALLLRTRYGNLERIIGGDVTLLSREKMG